MSNKARIVGSFKNYVNLWKSQRNYDKITEIIHARFPSSHAINTSDAHILDIGCGSAFAMNKLHHKFNRISLIEPNPHFAKLWNGKWIYNVHTLHAYPTTIEDVMDNALCPPSSVDVILSHHTLYHYPLERLEKLIQYKMSLLKEKESSFMIISVFDDDSEFIQQSLKRINPKYAVSETLESVLNRKQIQYQVDISDVVLARKMRSNMNDFLKWIVLQYGCNTYWMEEADVQELESSVQFDNVVNAFIDHYCQEFGVCGGHVYECKVKVKHYTVFR